MASFTDDTKALGNFNPYIQQLPIEAMTSVGIEKQKRYDEGIQKIQANIENIAGLDVIRDVDKQYLQGKMNQLGTKLKTVAAGDFSNYQLTNSVGGMVTQIAKDTNIQNAVYSTSKYRRGLTAMEVAKQEGKSAPSNEWLFNNEANQWLNSGDPSTKFNGSYQPYTNYKKNALEVIKGLTKDETITDDAFTLDRNGNLTISDAVVRKKLSGISPDKIQQALLAGLTPADFKQMEIDGRYNYSNISGEDFINRINSSYKTKVDFYSKQKAELEAAKLQTQSNVQKNKLDEQIYSLDKTIGGITREHQQMSSRLAAGDVESAKAQLETSNFINNFSKAFSYTETSQTYENSPFAQMQMRREEKDQDWKKFMLNYQQDERQFGMNFQLEQQKLAETKRANAAKEAADGKEEMGYGGLPTSIDKKDVPQYTLDRVVADVQQGRQYIQNADRAFLNKWGKNEQWLEEQKEAWKKRPNKVDPLIAQHFNETEQARRKIESDIVMLGTINKMAEQKFGDINSMIPKDGQTWVYGSPQGTFSISPKDIVNFNSTFNKYRNIGKTPFSSVKSDSFKSPAITYNDELASKELSKKELVLYNIYKKKDQGQPLSKAERVIADDSNKYMKTVNQPFAAKLKDINTFTAQEVTNRLSGNQGVAYEIPTGKPELRTSFGTLLTRVADFAEKEGNGLAGSPDFDIEIAKKLAVDPHLTGSITVVEGTSLQPAMYEINVTGEKGESTKFRMTPEQKNAVFGNRFEASPQVQALRPYQEQIRKMGGYTTAFNGGSSNSDNAFLNNIDFPSVNTYGVRANLVNSDGGYSIRLSVYDPITGRWNDDIPYPRTGLMTEDRVVGAMRNLNDSAIYEILHDRVPSDKDLKILQEAAKKPK